MAYARQCLLWQRGYTNWMGYEPNSGIDYPPVYVIYEGDGVINVDTWNSQIEDYEVSYYEGNSIPEIIQELDDNYRRRNLDPEEI